MKTLSLVIALAFLGLGSPARTAEDPFELIPKAGDIEAAINDGIQLKYPDWQEITDLKIVKGGKTKRGEWVHICTAKLVWKVDTKQFQDAFTTEAKAELQKQIAPKGLKDLATSFIPLSVKLVLGDFKEGDTVAEVRFRVSLILAGEDWVVLDSKFPPGFKNPVDKLYEKPEKS